MPGVSFDLCIDPNVRFVSAVRRFVESTLERAISDPETAFRVAMTTHELLENAGKFCTSGGILLHFNARLDGPDPHVDVCLRHRASDRNALRLRKRLADLEAAPSLRAHYQELLRGQGERNQESEPPGLGLARIAAEAQMNLRVDVDGGTVAVKASMRTSPSKP